MSYEHLELREGEGRNILEAKLRAALRELRKLDAEYRALQRQPRVRPGHHAPCPAMLDDEAVCTCGQ